MLMHFSYLLKSQILYLLAILLLVVLLSFHENSNRARPFYVRLHTSHYIQTIMLYATVIYSF